MKELENLSAFRGRTAGFTSDGLPHSGGLEINTNLPLKVGIDVKMEPFMGEYRCISPPGRDKAGNWPGTEAAVAGLKK